MQGVQPIAKMAPSPNDASQPPRDVTSRPPSRCPNPPPPGVANATEPVAVATDSAAPASSGRQVRSRIGIRTSPVRLMPRITRIRPPIQRSSSMYWAKPLAAYVAVTPSSVKTAPKPST